MIATVARWLEVPLAGFVHDARVRMALVLDTSGRVFAQHGFTRSVDVMTACALAAAIHASASELGRQLGSQGFGPVHHGGADRQAFLAPVPGTDRPLLLLAVFDRASSLGIVRHFYARLLASVVRAHPEPPSGDAALDFERELGRNLAVLFGRA